MGYDKIMRNGVTVNLIKRLALACCGITLTASVCAAGNARLNQMEIEAGKAAMGGDFQTAIRIYDQILSADSSNAEVYVQRSLMYRELGNVSKSMSDAAIALDLLERQFAQGRQKANLYRQRANAKRLLRKFPEAKVDMETAIKMSRSNKWVPDLQAIYLEEKMYANQ